jgi:GNAT superfamily N-acetyltransferase
MPVFRRILPSEIEMVRDHYLRLDSDSRILRFHGLVGDETIIAHCRTLDWRCAHFVGCFVDDMLRGVAELQLDRPFLPHRGEAAVSVEKPYIGRGIGTELLRQLLAIARNRGVENLLMLCLIDNEAMRHVAGKFTHDLRVGQGEVAADVALPFPSCFSLWQEAAATGLGLIGAWCGRTIGGARAA